MKTAFLIGTILLTGCVSQADLDAWKGVPVAALDTHSLFLDMPVERTVTEAGIEIRTYPDGAGCDNIFFIRKGIVVEYRPEGFCVTDPQFRPQPGWEKFHQADLDVFQADLDAWKGVPVAALDTHSLFLTMLFVRRITDGGIEIRNYWGREADCDDFFYIRDGIVIEYRTEGRCTTDQRVRPQPGWEKFQ